MLWGVIPRPWSTPRCSPDCTWRSAAARVAALSRELQQIQRERYVDQQARAYGLGKMREIAFSLDPNASPLPADAPGSASVRLGTTWDDGSPLDHWLTLLFGSDD